jgi:hypothetical protein
MAGLAAQLRYIKSLYFGPPPAKVRRIAPRNVLAAVPSFFSSPISRSFPEQFSPNPFHFFGWELTGFFVVMRQGVMQDLEYAMRTKVGSSATTPFHDPLGHALKTIESCH